MKIRFDIYLIGVILFFAACTSTRKASGHTASGFYGNSTDSITVPLPPTEYSAQEKATFYYLQGIRMEGIYGDPVVAMACLNTALEYDSLHAPSYFELSNQLLAQDLEKAAEFSRMANRIEPENIWYKQQLGRIYILGNQYDEARKVYGEIVKLAPNNPDNYRYLAALYEETGFPYAAITLLDSAEVRFGFIEELSSFKRQLLIHTGMYERAISETIMLTNNSPYDERNFVVLGDLYARMGKDSLALNAYDQALSIDPANVEALMSMADFYRRKDDGANFLSVTKQLFEIETLPLDKKLEFFNDVIKNAQFYQKHYFAVNELVSILAVKHAGNREVIELYAEHQINSGNVTGALETYKGALSDTTGVALYKMIIEIEAYQGNNDSVTRYANLALEKYPGEMELYFSKGYSQYYMKKYDESISTFTEALKFAPDDSIRSVLYGSMGEIEHAKDSLSKTYPAYYKQALKYNPENLHAIYNYSDYLVKAGKNPEGALKNLKNDSLRSMMLGTIGDMYYAKNNDAGLRKAFEYYDKALKLDPDNIHVLNNYSYFLSVKGTELEKALAMSARVMEIEPGNPTYIDTYGWILYKMGRYEEAKQALRQAVSFDAGASKELLIHYGDILYELEEYFMASVYWKKALEKGYDPKEIEKRLKKTEGK